MKETITILLFHYHGSAIRTALVSVLVACHRVQSTKYSEGGTAALGVE